MLLGIENVGWRDLLTERLLLGERRDKVVVEVGIKVVEGGIRILDGSSHLDQTAAGRR